MFVYLIVAAGLNLLYVIGRDRGICGGPLHLFGVEDNDTLNLFTVFKTDVDPLVAHA